MNFEMVQLLGHNPVDWVQKAVAYIGMPVTRVTECMIEQDIQSLEQSCANRKVTKKLMTDNEQNGLALLRELLTQVHLTLLYGPQSTDDGQWTHRRKK